MWHESQVKSFDGNAMTYMEQGCVISIKLFRRLGFLVWWGFFFFLFISWRTTYRFSFVRSHSVSLDCILRNCRLVLFFFSLSWVLILILFTDRLTFSMRIHWQGLFHILSMLSFSFFFFMVCSFLLVSSIVTIIKEKIIVQNNEICLDK